MKIRIKRWLMVHTRWFGDFHLTSSSIESRMGFSQQPMADWLTKMYRPDIIPIEANYVFESNLYFNKPNNLIRKFF